MVLVPARGFKKHLGKMATLSLVESLPMKIMNYLVSSRRRPHLLTLDQARAGIRVSVGPPPNFGVMMGASGLYFREANVKSQNFEWIIDLIV
jgi:hypothetical protein